MNIAIRIFLSLLSVARCVRWQIAPFWHGLARVYRYPWRRFRQWQVNRAFFRLMKENACLHEGCDRFRTEDPPGLCSKHLKQYKRKRIYFCPACNYSRAACTCPPCSKDNGLDFFWGTFRPKKGQE